MYNKRQTIIMDYLTKNGEAKNSELLPLIGDCSMMTLIRDLNKLEKDGQLLRTHGGAVIAPQVQVKQELAFDYRINQNTLEKDDIAWIATTLISPNHAYYFDSGSTILSMAQQINEEHHAIVTSAANTAIELSRSGNNTVTLLGGQFSANTLSSSGPQAQRMLQDINVDVAFMATSGYSTHGGFTVGSLSEAELKREVIRKSALTIMLLDHSKINKSYPFTFAQLDAVDIVIGDKFTDDFIAEAGQHDVLLFSSSDGRTSDERINLFNQLLKNNY